MNARKLLRYRQRFILVLQKHNRLSHRFAGYGSMLGRAECGMQFSIGRWRPAFIHQSHGELDAQDAGNGIIDTRHRHPAFGNEFFESIKKPAVIIGLHCHIHPGVDGYLNRSLVIAWFDLSDGVVVRNQETLESELLLEDFCKQPFAGGTLHSVPAAVGRHDAPDAGAYSGYIARQVNPSQRGFINLRVPLIEPQSRPAFALRESRTRHRAGSCASVSNIVFGAGQNRQWFGQIEPLHSPDGGSTKTPNYLRILRISFIGSSPANVLRDSNARAEGPLNSCCADFFCRNPADLLYQHRIAGTSKSDIVGKYYRSLNVAVAVHSIDAVKNRNRQSCLQGFRLNFVVQISPCLEAIAFYGIRVATAKHGSDEILLHIARIAENRPLFRLCHLPDFFFKRHLRQQFPHLRIIGCKLPGNRRNGRHLNSCQQNTNHDYGNMGFHRAPFSLEILSPGSFRACSRTLRTKMRHGTASKCKPVSAARSRRKAGSGIHADIPVSIGKRIKHERHEIYEIDFRIFRVFRVSRVR